MRITALIALLLLPGAWSKAGDGEDLPTDAPLRIGIKKRIPADECVKAHKGQKLKMHYRGTLYADGEEFDSSYGRDEPFEFTLGQSEVIAGWDQGEKIENLTVEHGVSLVWLLGRALKKTDPAAVGLLLKRRNPQTIAPPTPARARAGLVGMCKGEQRKLTIPSDLGYGSAGSPPSIPGYVVRCGAAARGGGSLLLWSDIGAGARVVGVSRPARHGVSGLRSGSGPGADRERRACWPAGPRFGSPGCACCDGRVVPCGAVVAAAMRRWSSRSSCWTSATPTRRRRRRRRRRGRRRSARCQTNSAKPSCEPADDGARLAGQNGG